MKSTIKKRLPSTFTARGRHFTHRQLQLVDHIVRRYSSEGRTKISERVCKALRWKQPNGRLKDMACREVLRRLEAFGCFALPPGRTQGAAWPQRKIAQAYADNTTPVTSIDFRALDVVRVQTARQRHLWNQLVDEFHYLHSSRLIGRQVKYIVYSGTRPLACLGWSDAAWAIRARDAWIGWSRVQIPLRRHLIINNSRFLIVPWVKVPNLASHILARCAKIVVEDWNAAYDYRPVLLETFVDSERFPGTCYRAANWICVGTTSGYAKVGNSHHNSQAPKELFLYPQHPKCRSILKGKRVHVH